MLVGIQAMWGGLCGAVTAGYTALTGWAGVVATTTGNGIATLGQKMLGQ